jgi:hypothetical protein
MTGDGVKGSLERVAVGIDLELTAVVCALQRNNVRHATYRTTLIFPA